MGKPNSEFSLLLTLEGASLTARHDRRDHGLDEARDPVTTPAHKPFVVVTPPGRVIAFAPTSYAESSATRRRSASGAGRRRAVGGRK